MNSEFPVVIVKRSAKSIIVVAVCYSVYIGSQRQCSSLAVCCHPATYRSSSPHFWLKCSSAGIICMCRASSTASFYPLQWSSTVVSSHWIAWWFSHTCSATANFSHLSSLFTARAKHWQRFFSVGNRFTNHIFKPCLHLQKYLASIKKYPCRNCLNKNYHRT